MRKEKKYHYIYKTTCNVTEKYYLGMHSTDKLDDGYLGSGRRLKYSINKYGKNNHTKEILEYSNNREELRLREAEIVTLDEISKENCLNLNIGGGQNATYCQYLSDAHKEKISFANSGEKNGMYGKRFIMSDKHKNKISTGLLESDKLKESRNSEEYKNKLKDHFGKRIFILDINFVFICEYQSMKDAMIFFGCKESNIFNARRDKRMIKRKYWVVYPEDVEKLKKEKQDEYR
jgi:hypothetical protein